MKITVDWLRKLDCCEEAVRAFAAQPETDSLKIMRQLMREKRFGWANWLIVRLMERTQYIRYAIFAAEQVLDIFEKKYPDDKRPRLAIEAARNCLTDDSADARFTDAAASWAAAACAASTAADAAYAAFAAYAAAAASRAAANASWAAAANASWAAAAARCAVDANTDAEEAIQLKILEYGMKLLGAK